MIWTAPVTVSSGLEPGQHAQPQSHSTGIISDRSGESDPDASMMPPLGFSAAMQARSLNIASAYFKSLDFPALIALSGTHCPGTLGMGGCGWVGWVVGRSVGYCSGLNVSTYQAIGMCFACGIIDVH